MWECTAELRSARVPARERCRALRFDKEKNNEPASASYHHRLDPADEHGE